VALTQTSADGVDSIRKYAKEALKNIGILKALNVLFDQDQIIEQEEVLQKQTHALNTKKGEKRWKQ